MEKKLPSVFVNNVKKINNNKEIFYSAYSNDKLILKNDPEINESLRMIKVNKKINDIFSSNSFIYKMKVKIVYKTGEVKEEVIIARNNNSLLTMNNERIDYKLINDIYAI